MFCKAQRVTGLLICQDFWALHFRRYDACSIYSQVFYPGVLKVGDGDDLIFILIGRVWDQTYGVLVMHSGVPRFRFHFEHLLS
jgi:hypothetical protein